jgi:dolichol kinase
VAGTANAAKSAGGSIALVVIAIIALFPLTSLLGIKIGLSLAQFASELLDNNSIDHILSKANSLINFMIASVGLSASVFAICAASFISQSVSL